MFITWLVINNSFIIITRLACGKYCQPNHVCQAPSESMSRQWTSKSRSRRSRQTFSCSVAEGTVTAEVLRVLHTLIAISHVFL